MRQWGRRLRAAAELRMNGTRQAVADPTGMRLEGTASSNAASAGSDPEHARKRSSWRRFIASELPKLKIPGPSSSSSAQCGTICVPGSLEPKEHVPTAVIRGKRGPGRDYMRSQQPWLQSTKNDVRPEFSSLHELSLMS